MRLEVLCQDRLGLAHELLDLLVAKEIDLYGIEIREQRIWFRFRQIPFELFSTLMTEIRQTAGVLDVRTASYMPSESGGRFLSALLDAIPEPVLSVDVKGQIEQANPAALQLLQQTLAQVLHTGIEQWLPGVDLNRWLEKKQANTLKQQLSIQGRDFELEARPIYLPTDQQLAEQSIGAVILLKPLLLTHSPSESVRRSELDAFSGIIAESPKMRQIITQAKKLSRHDAPLMITGETGTGKDMLALACHRYSDRYDKPFLALNCASLPEDVAESELYGHAAGAYPNAYESKKGFFEQANGGTVLLDDVAEMSNSMQIKLLRFLNDGTFRRVGDDHQVHVDVRVICTTQQDLQQRVNAGKFRQDLFFRLNVLSLTLPPLREHPQDIIPLTQMFIARYASEKQLPSPVITTQLTSSLMSYAWPGNVRQLKNTLYRALAQSDGHQLGIEDICLPGEAGAIADEESDLTGSLDEITRRFERNVLTRLYRHYPSTRKLAHRLGVSHTAIANKLREYGLGHKK